jgi:ectoine hydroxylase-related dioxygenase (phytanoyl-CoA dioxygenase family)
MPALNADALCQYRSQGFAVMRGLIPPEVIGAVRESYADVERLDPGQTRATFYYELSLSDPGRRLLRRIERVSDHSAAASALIHSALLLAPVIGFLGEPAALFKDKLNLKLPGAAGFRPHVDGHFYWTDAQGNRRRGWAEYATRFINVVVPLDEARIENGCLEISALDEALAVFGRDWETVTARLAGTGPDILERDLPRLSMVALEVDPGDVIFFDWRNPHQSGPNRSGLSRRILYATYNPRSQGDCRERYYADKLHSSRGSRAQQALLERA